MTPGGRERGGSPRGWMRRGVAGGRGTPGRSGGGGWWLLLPLLAGAALPLTPADLDAQRFRGSEARMLRGADGDPGGLSHPYNGQFTFTRIRFGQPQGFGGFGRGRAPFWAHDYPRADRNFMSILEYVTHLDARVRDTSVLDLDDPELMKFPVAYLVEPGYWNPTDGEVAALRNYILKGGFLFVDDFGGPREWANTEQQFSRALPGLRWIEVDGTHAIFQAFYQIDDPGSLVNYRGAPIYLALFEDNDPSKRIMVMANYNNDIGDFWEWADDGLVTIGLENRAFQIGVNYIIYALSR
jgi:hypothetical protein